MRNSKKKNALHIKISGEPLDAITDFFKYFSKYFETSKNIPLTDKTIFEGKQFTDKLEFTKAIILSFSKKYPDLARKFYALAESKSMNREMAIEIKTISPLWYQTVMEYFQYGKSS